MFCPVIALCCLTWHVAFMRKQQVEVVTPCGVEWNSLARRGNARFCGECSKLVHDLSSMKEEAARALLRTSKENLCVRYLYDATGQIHFAQAPIVPLGRLAWRKVARAAVLSAPVLLQACGGADAGPFRSDFDDFCTPTTASSSTARPTSTTEDGGVPSASSSEVPDPCAAPTEPFPTVSAEPSATQPEVAHSTTEQNAGSTDEPFTDHADE